MVDLYEFGTRSFEIVFLKPSIIFGSCLEMTLNASLLNIFKVLCFRYIYIHYDKLRMFASGKSPFQALKMPFVYSNVVQLARTFNFAYKQVKINLIHIIRNRLIFNLYND